MTVETRDGRRLLRLVSPSAGYLSSYVGPLHFGLGDSGQGGSAPDAIERVVVTWPDGTVESFASPDVDIKRRVVLQRGEGAP
jgi:hypothetical protein